VQKDCHTRKLNIDDARDRRIVVDGGSL